MRIVVDTNVLVSGFRENSGNCFDIIDLIVTGKVEACYNTAMLLEYQEVLGRRKFKFDQRLVQMVLDLIEKDEHLVTAVALPPLKDRTDTKFLEVAVSGDCQYLVTGNLKDFPKSFGTVTVVSPVEFLLRFRNR